MKTSVKNDYLLKVSRENNKGEYEVMHIHYYDKTDEEIKVIATGYRTRSHSLVRIYKLETVL